MYKQQVTVQNETGLHARPASDFVEAAGKFNSKISLYDITEPDFVCNAKSIVILLSMGVGKGSTIEIVAEGDDEQQAVETLVALVESKFGEE